MEKAEESWRRTMPLCQVPILDKYDSRSANCELKLKPGTYEMLPKVRAQRHSKAKTTGEI
jgi:hypothetical protein